MITPVFLLSLPRSGSTLLQRLIATHPQVDTTSEPWVLLPPIYGFLDSHVFAAYQQRHLATAFNEFLDSVQGGRSAYFDAVRLFADRLYDAAVMDGATHFLDKTPRYHLIAEELLDCFPNARFVLLWRNPLAIAASCIEHWGGGRMNLHHYRIDLYQGFSNLHLVHCRQDQRVLEIQYEELVRNPEESTQRIFDHLKLPRTKNAVSRLQDSSLSGSLGDKKGAKKWSTVHSDAADAWPRALSGPIRRAWAKRYLLWIGQDRLRDIGYDVEELSWALSNETVTSKHFLSDAARLAFGAWSIKFELAYLRRRRRLSNQGFGVDFPIE